MFPDRNTPSRCRSAGLAVGGVVGQLARAAVACTYVHERRCSWRLRALTSSMHDERCCVHGEVCAPRYVLFLVAPIGARILAGGLICCSIWVIHALLDLRSSSDFLCLGSDCSGRSKLPCCSASCCAVPCLLSVCFLQVAARVLPIATDIDMGRVTIPANKGAEGAFKKKP